MRHRFRLGIVLAILALLVDQLSKWWILDVKRLVNGRPEYVTSFFNLTLVHNRGVSFGMLGGVDHTYIAYGLVTMALAVVFLLGRWLWLTTSTIVALALGLIIGGALGNVIDRVRYGAVTDFLDFHYADAFNWPAFNGADSMIVAGVALLLIDGMVRAK